MILELALADLLGTAQSERGDKVRQALSDGFRVWRVSLPIGAGPDSPRRTVSLHGPGGRTSVELSLDELTVVADYACGIGHPDAEALALAAAGRS